jgi:hypothetical protein
MRGVPTVNTTIPTNGVRCVALTKGCECQQPRLKGSFWFVCMLVSSQPNWRGISRPNQKSLPSRQNAKNTREKHEHRTVRNTMTEV